MIVELKAYGTEHIFFEYLHHHFIDTFLTFKTFSCKNTSWKPQKTWSKSIVPEAELSYLYLLQRDCVTKFHSFKSPGEHFWFFFSEVLFHVIESVTENFDFSFHFSFEPWYLLLQKRSYLNLVFISVRLRSEFVEADLFLKRFFFSFTFCECNEYRVGNICIHTCFLFRLVVDLS